MLPLILRVPLPITIAILVVCWPARLAFGAETPAGDEALRAAVPENAIPQLKEILAKAVANAPRVISAGLDYEQSGVGVKQARAPMLPSVSLSGNLGQALNQYDHDEYEEKDSSTGLTVLNEDGSPKIKPAKSTSAVVTDFGYYGGIYQPVFRWGALKKGFQSAQLQRAISERNLAETRRLLALDVRRAYFNLVSAANARDMERTTLANLEKEWAYLKQQAADGFITTSIASSAEIQITNYKLQMRRSESAYEAQWRAFRQLAGLDESFVVELPKELPALSKDMGPIVVALSDRQEGSMPVSLLNAEDSIRAERLNYEIQKTRLRPYFGIAVTASRGYHTPDSVVGFGGPYVLTSYGASATMNWNIFDGFSTQASKQSSLIRLRQLKNSRDQLERDYQENLKSYVNTLRFNWDSLQTTELNLTSYRSLVETYQKDYELGFVPKKIWDDSKTTADNYLQTANSVRADYYMAIVNYLSLRGIDPAVNSAAKN